MSALGSVMRRLREHPSLRTLVAGDGLFGRFAYLALTQGIVVIIGLAYWGMVARLVPVHSVGLAAAAVTAGTFLSALGALGAGSLLVAEIRHIADEDRYLVISSGVAIVAVASGCLALIMLAFSHFLGHNISTLGHQPLAAALIVVGTIFTGVASLLDSIAIGMARSRVQLVRNVCASALRFAIVMTLVAVGVRSTDGLLVGWTLSLGISFLSWVFLVRLPHDSRDSWAARAHVVRRCWSMSLRHHVLNLAITSVTYLLPALAALILLSREYAYFSVAQLVSATALLLPALLAVSLFAETTGDAVLLHRSVRRTLPVGLACCLAVVVIVEPLAPAVLSVFGHNYAQHGATTLRLLVLGGLAYVVKDHYVGIRRAQRRLTQAAKAVAIGTGVEFVAAAVGAALYGVQGLCGFWVLATMCEAAFFLPVVWGVVYGDPAADRSMPSSAHAMTSAPWGGPLRPGSATPESEMASSVAIGVTRPVSLGPQAPQGWRPLVSESVAATEERVRK